MNGFLYRMRKLRRLLRRDEPLEYVYVFNHIPKAGGTAVRFVMEQWHAIVPDYRRGSDERETRRFVENPLCLSRVRRPAFVCGHYGLEGARLHERYPQVFGDPRFRLITFVRDPLETAISMYYYVHKLGHRTFARDVEKFLRHYRTNFAAALNCREDNIASAMSAYWFVGLTERLPASIALLSSMLRRPYIEPPLMNSTRRPPLPETDAVQVFRRNNALDYAIYAHVRDRLSAELDAAGFSGTETDAD